MDEKFKSKTGEKQVSASQNNLFFFKEFIQVQYRYSTIFMLLTKLKGQNQLLHFPFSNFQTKRKKKKSVLWLVGWVNIQEIQIKINSIIL